jgi:hypothetical protein
MSNPPNLAAIREERFTTHAERVVAERHYAAEERDRLREIAAWQARHDFGLQPGPHPWLTSPWIDAAPSTEALEALYDLGFEQRPWGVGKSEAEIDAEVERRVAAWAATR